MCVACHSLGTLGGSACIHVPSPKTTCTLAPSSYLSAATEVLLIPRGSTCLASNKNLPALAQNLRAFRFNDPGNISLKPAILTLKSTFALVFTSSSCLEVCGISDCGGVSEACLHISRCMHLAKQADA